MDRRTKEIYGFRPTLIHGFLQKLLRVSFFLKFLPKFLLGIPPAGFIFHKFFQGYFKKFLLCLLQIPILNFSRNFSKICFNPISLDSFWNSNRNCWGNCSRDSFKNHLKVLQKFIQNFPQIFILEIISKILKKVSVVSSENFPEIPSEIWWGILSDSSPGNCPNKALGISLEIPAKMCAGISPGMHAEIYFQMSKKSFQGLLQTLIYVLLQVFL